MKACHLSEIDTKLREATSLSQRIEELKEFLYQADHQDIDIVVKCPGRGPVAVSSENRNDYQNNIHNQNRSALATMAKIVGQEALARLQQQLEEIKLPV